MMPATAYAQSTGSVEFDKEAIVVTGSRTKDVGGIQTPDAAKAKAVVTQEMISRSGPGQTVLDTINIVPGVSFQNNDAYGNSGGTLDDARLRFDPRQLHARRHPAERQRQLQHLFELLDRSGTDRAGQRQPRLDRRQLADRVGRRRHDQPAHARPVGRTRAACINASLGEFDYRRLFAMVDTGTFTKWGTRAFIAGSTSKYDNPFNNYGKLDRQQYNAKIYQPIGTNGDFVSIAGRYNQDRNNFFGSLPLRWDADRVVGSGTGNRFPRNNDEREYDINYPCTIDAPQPASPTRPNSCGTEFDRRYNPSNSINIRGNSKFSITDQLTLTVDPSFQYTKANGGGTVHARREYGYDINPTRSDGRANCSTAAPTSTSLASAATSAASPT